MLQIRPRRTLAAGLVALATITGLVGAPSAGADGGAKNVVVAMGEGDGRAHVRSNVQVAPVFGPRAEPENVALAKASCTDCRTVAVAVQATLVSDEADLVAPRNAGVAVNGGCTRCVTVALAYQYVVSVDRPVSISDAGQRRIAELRAEIAAVAASGRAPADMDAALDLLVAELWALIDAEIAADGARATGSPSEETRVLSG